jgi:hypothetical protein
MAVVGHKRIEMMIIFSPTYPALGFKALAALSCPYNGARVCRAEGYHD